MIGGGAAAAASTLRTSAALVLRVTSMNSCCKPKNFGKRG
jgi:hypothetical protein